MSVNKPVQKRPLGDPAIDAAMGGLNNDPLYGRMAARTTRMRSMTPAQRRQHERNQARCKMTFDLPPELKERISEVAGDNECPPSHLAAILLKAGLEKLDAGEINLYLHRYPANIPRFKWFLALEPDE